MSENGVKGARRSRRQLSPETKWEVFLQVTSGALSQADAARKWQVDVSTIIGIRRTAKDAALAAFARKPGRPRPSGIGSWKRRGRRSTVDVGDHGASDRAGGGEGKIRLGLTGPLPASFRKGTLARHIT